MRNYGKRIQGPWVFGNSRRKAKILEKKFLILKGCDLVTFILIIRNRI